MFPPSMIVLSGVHFCQNITTKQCYYGNCHVCHVWNTSVIEEQSVVKLYNSTTYSQRFAMTGSTTSKTNEWDGSVRKLSFSGCGFRASYHLGVIQCLRDRGRDLLEQIEVFSGCSAGGLCAAITLLECPVDKALNFIRQMVREIQSSYLGSFSPNFLLEDYLRDGIDFLFPKHAHKLATNRLHLSVTRPENISNKIITQYDTRKEFIDAIIASSYIPGYVGMDFPTYKGEKFVDGGLTNNLPYADDMHTITVCPLSGDFDICPTDPHKGRYSVGCYPLVGHKLDFSWFNLQNVYRGLFPSSVEAIDELYREGYRDAMRFLRNQRYTQDFSPKIHIPMPATCPILSYTSEGSICVDMDCLMSTDDSVFLECIEEVGIFETENQKSKIPNTTPEIQSLLSDLDFK